MTAILTKLADRLGQDKTGQKRLQFYSPHVWLYKNENASITIKIETILNDDYVFVNASFARDGSGPLLASFMSMLLIEDSHATSPDTFGICSGAASVSLYHMLDISDLTENRLIAYLHNFEYLAFCIFEQAGIPSLQAPYDKAQMLEKELL